MRDGDRLQPLDRHDLLPPARADAGDRVPPEPGPDLGHGVPLCRVQRLGHLSVAVRKSVYTVYAPQHHKPGKVHQTKAIADTDTADEPADWSVQPEPVADQHA